MIFDFGQLAEFYNITAQFSNAVLLAVIPHVADFAQKLELRPAAEFNTNAIRRLWLNQKRDDVAGSIEFTNGYSFGFAHGYIDSFTAPHAFTSEQDPENVPSYYGPVRLTKAEAISFARRSLTRLGHSVEAVFADLEPEVVLPERVGTNWIPVYQITWPDPQGGRAVEFEINASEKSLKKLRLWSCNLWRAKFPVPVEPPERSTHPIGPDHPFGRLAERKINPDYVLKLFPIVLEAVTNFASRLQISVPHPLTTNHLERFWVDDNGGWPHAELTLTNGTRFIYRNTKVCGYYAPDNFWNENTRNRKGCRLLLSEVGGSWKMSDAEMIALARRTLSRLDYPKEMLHTGAVPELVKPKGEFEKRIPRCLVQWMHPSADQLTQWSYVEIDADRKTVKAVYLDDKTFWGHNPLPGTAIRKQ